jgi:molybdopterin-containing oxidoreductase family iron-sulfur binding subunit
VIPGTALPIITPTLRRFTLPPPAKLPASPGLGIELVFQKDAVVYDGRFANNSWLQELPRPLDRLTWDNVAFVSPRTAQRLGVHKKDGMHGREISTEIFELTFEGRKVRAPLWIQPGQPDDCITLTLGYGRRRAGHIGSGVGYNAYELRTAHAQWSGAGLSLSKTGKHQWLASTQLHFLMEGRSLVRSSTLTEYKKDPHGKHEEGEGSKSPPSSLTLYPEYSYPGYAWGMAIGQVSFFV